MVENPGEPAVARQLVVLQPQTLQSGGKYFCEENLIVQNQKPGQPGHQVAGQGGEVVGVEGERDQLGQVGQAGRVQAPDLVVVQLAR